MFENVIGVESFSALDFPNKISAILFYGGCQLHCPYCYNVGVVKKTMETEWNGEKIEDLLRRRRGLLDAVVFSGGECTLSGDKLLEDVRFVKSLGFLVKIDTNGTNPSLVKRMIDEQLVDMFSLDVKCPQEQWKTFFPSLKHYQLFEENLKLVMESGVRFETRTTVHPDVIDENGVKTLLEWLRGIGVRKHYVQLFFKAEETLGNVNPDPRPFDMDKVKCDGVEVVVRNDF